MNATLGRVTAQLEQPTEPLNTDLVELINTNINPPAPVGYDDVYIRALYIISDEVNSYGGCFPADEHQRLAEMLVDSPVMVGHRKDRLPIGRNFHATVTSRDGRSWVKCYFYWLKSAQGADNLRDNIDGGIYKECSLAFTYWLPECSICGKDIRVCPHEPTHGNNDSRECHFNYRQIERVLETSLVYRGAIPNTGVTKELEQACSHTDARATDELRDGVTLVREPKTDSALIAFSGGGLRFFMRLYQYDPIRFRRGVRFLADLYDESDELIAKVRRTPDAMFSPLLDVFREEDNRLVVALDADWAKQIVVKCIRIDGRDRFLVSCLQTGR